MHFIIYFLFYITASYKKRKLSTLFCISNNETPKKDISLNLKKYRYISCENLSPY